MGDYLNQRVREADIHFIVNELIAHEHCVNNKEMLFGALQLPPLVEDDLKFNYRMEGSSYGYFKGMIASWIQLKGNEASTYALDKALREIDCNAVADNLRDKWFIEARPTAGPSTIRDSIQTGPAWSRKHSSIWFNMKEPIPSYTKREDKLNEVSELLFPTNTEIKPIQIAIAGLGGIGKSEFARNFAQKYDTEFGKNVVWVNAKTAQVLVDSFKELASHIGVKFAELFGKAKILELLGNAEILRMADQVYGHFGEKKSIFIFDIVEPLMYREYGVKNYLLSKMAHSVKIKKFDEIIELFKSTLQLREELHPENRKSVNEMGCWIAYTTQLSGNFAEALQMFRNVHAELVESFGERDLDTLRCARQIGECLQKLGRHEDAMEILQHNMELANENPSGRVQRVHMQYSIAKVLVKMERYDEAIGKLRIVLEEVLSIYGETHPFVLTARVMLANALQLAGCTGKAVQDYTFLYENRIEILGVEHTETVSVEECMESGIERDTWFTTCRSAAETDQQNAPKYGLLNEPIWFNMRDPISSFTGREDALEKVHNIFFPASVGQQDSSYGKINTTQVAVVGIGGIGKSEFARKFATVYYTEFGSNVAWINAKSAKFLQQSFKILAAEFGIDTTNLSGKKDYLEMIKSVYEHFGDSKSLFIFDNVESWFDGEDAIKDYLPKGPVVSESNAPYVLMTSRNRAKVSKNVVQKCINLSVLTEVEAAELIQSRLDTDNFEFPLQLAKILGCLPLALQQAISYIQHEIEEDISGMARQEVVAKCIQSYIEIFDTEAKILLDYKDADFDADFEELKTTRDTWRITLEKIKGLNPNATQLLKMMSYISPDDIHLKMFKTQFVNGELGAAVNTLLKFSMITKHSIQSNIISMHSLVQLVVRLENDENQESTLENEKMRNQVEENKPLESILNLLELILVGLPDIRTHYSTSCVIHAQMAWEYAIALPKLLKQFKDYPTILFKKAELHGMRQAILPLLQRTLSKYKEYHISGESDEDYIRIQQLIACTLPQLHKYEDAKSMCQIVHESVVDELEESYQLTLAILNNLSLADSGLGNYSEQMIILDKIIAANIKSPNIAPYHVFNASPHFEWYHKDTLTPFHNKEERLENMSKYNEDLEVFKSMLELKEKHHPEDRKSINDTRYWIALTIYRQGNFEEALHMLRNLHAELIQSFGESHTRTLHCARQIGDCLVELGKYQEAIEMLKRNIKLANENPSARVQRIHMQYSMAKILFKMEMHDEAISQFRNVLDEQSSTYGETHTELLTTREQLTHVMQNAGCTGEALDHYKFVYENRTKTLGAGHPET